ncbi:uncharacterized protein LAESUDRAFT_715663 [Laetiporus sulphureus 93-53]|uniref:Uncharacterized protein n=1 Tax=Laetiporus sulphureus 93-53 TaxID=1314785 RepID=A0A165D9J8_9APHY|nr:uncharacterized protein LAESUDRAFT_715663 [Laetiporus sulphureus 93-53]KZT04386.1 hypothetical protein LAESUDRAFT_715663 [Laetiporus sulphureus 93-53]
MATLPMLPLERSCPRKSTRAHTTLQPRMVIRFLDWEPSQADGMHRHLGPQLTTTTPPQTGASFVEANCQDRLGRQMQRNPPPRSVTEILADPTATNLRKSPGQRGLANMNSAYSVPDQTERSNACRMLIRDVKKATHADNDESTGIAHHTAVWLLQSAADIDWSEFSRVRASASYARQIAGRKAEGQTKGSETTRASVFPTCKYKPSPILAYLHSDLHLHRHAVQRWKRLSENERHEATVRAFYNGPAEATDQAVSADKPLTQESLEDFKRIGLGLKDADGAHTPWFPEVP